MCEPKEMVSRGVERRKNEKRSSGRLQAGRSGGVVEEEEDYGDYVTRCICEYKHDDGYMICCDECSVWQHVECMQVDPKNLPDNYLCELCEPRSVDKRRAQKIQMKKREDISDAEEGNKRKRVRSPLPRSSLVTSGESRKGSSLPAPSSSSSSSSMPTGTNMSKKRKKRGKLTVSDARAEAQRKSKKEGGSGGSGGVSHGSKKQRRHTSSSKGMGQLTPSSSIQSLLTAASLLDDDNDQAQGHLRNELWQADRSPWTDKYETAEQNLYTKPVQAFLVSRMEQLKSEAVVFTRDEYITSVARPHPQCCLAEVGHGRKGLVAQLGIPQDELVIECKCTIAVKQDILNDLGLPDGRGSSLWKYKPCPFVYLYDKITNLDICIDSRSYGNLARFIRRSCSPNAEVRHFFVSSELHFGVYALNHIAPNEEVTLPFDFPYENCDYPVECACDQAQSACLVVHSKLSTPASKSSVCMPADEDYPSPRNQNSSLHRSHSHVFEPQDEDSNSSWTSTGSSSRKRARISSVSTLKSHGSHAPSRDGSSDSEEETEKRRKSLSREERKTEQVWRVFEKMEASAQRRRQHLLSDGSHESDPLSSPSSLYPLSSRGLKDRRLSSSSSSRKTQMLPTVKMRLSSVSSADPLSPYDPSPSEPFSPHMAIPPEYHSPLLSPSTPTPHFQAAPQLHPKYLFADFALPWKKAILRQWETEQQNGRGPCPRSYWASNHSYLDCHVTSEMMRPRHRGSLKHRWLKHYNDTSGSKNDCEHVSSRDPNCGSDKENGESEMFKLPHKKRVLQRWVASDIWKESSILPISPVPMDTSDIPEKAAEGPSLPSPAPAAAAEKNSTEVRVDLVERRSSLEGRGSPLFDEFSDSDEFVEQKPPAQDDMVQQSKAGSSSPISLEAVETQSAVAEPSCEGKELTPLDSPVLPIGSPSQDHMQPAQEEKQEETTINNTADETSEPMESCDLVKEAKEMEAEAEEEAHNMSGVSDISLESISSMESATALPTAAGPQTPPPDSAPSPIGISTAGVSDISSDNMDSSSSPLPSAEEEPAAVKVQTAQPDAEKVLATEPEAVTVTTKPEELSVSILEERAHPPPLDPIMAPSSPIYSQVTPSKTPGKRKINLKEYRNRARKPAERKSSSENKVSPPPPSTPGTPSFLSHHHSLFSSSFSPYTSSLQLPTSSIGASTSPAHASTMEPIHSGSGPHFEPVSPEDDDHTPKLTTRDDPGTGAKSAVLSNVGVPAGTGLVGVAPGLAYSSTPVPGLYEPYNVSLQAPHSGVLPGYMVEGGRWVTAPPPTAAEDQAQDPRSRLTVIVPSSGGLIPVPGSGGGIGMGVLPAQQASGVMYPPQQQQQQQAYYQVQQQPQQQAQQQVQQQQQQQQAQRAAGAGGPMFSARHPPPPPGPNYY